MNKYFALKEILKIEAYKLFFKVNIDIFIRTLLLVIVTTFFTFASTSMGNDILSVNALLMQFFMLFSYFMDGFAYAGEALTGRFVGNKNQRSLNKMIKYLFLWGFSLSIISSFIYLFFTPNILSLLTDKQSIVELAQSFAIWTVAVPLTGFATFIWDGVYVGATQSRPMRDSMIVATILFFATYYLSVPHFGNNGLWLAFILYLIGRSGMQTIYANTILKNF